jgi:hypothetical protein
MDNYPTDKNPTDSQEAGLFLSLKECKCLYRRLNKEEAKLGDDELRVFSRMEKMLYSRLCISEIEELSVNNAFDN